MKTLDDTLLMEIQADLEGTMTSLAAIIEKYDLDISDEDIEDRLLDGNAAVERSVCCEWWFSPSDLEFDEEKNGGVCQQCEPDAFD
ncbi:MAG: hypothetical protein ABJN42_29005 [Roseibium sp.]|uniref:hypothetical protein n=1 Tax=Roseibium sp. TaxID=1936156 RepID=UPI00329A0FA0